LHRAEDGDVDGSSSDHGEGLGAVEACGAWQKCSCA
jgi:hypothetical protein